MKKPCADSQYSCSAERVKPFKLICSVKIVEPLFAGLSLITLAVLHLLP